MIFSMIHLVLISVIILAPWFLYKNPSRRMILFYQRMSYSTHCRLFYGKILLLTLILFHFVCYWMKPGEYGVMLSTVLVLYLFSAKRTLSLINGIRNSRGVMVFVFTIALVTLGYILLAVGFYPSSLLEGEKPSHKEFATYQEFQDDIIRNYYL